MPGTLSRIRREMAVGPTPHDKGLTLTLRITAYDNGMIAVDGVPINEAPGYEPAHGWLGAAEIVITTMNEFRRQAEKRQKDRAGTGREAPRRDARTPVPRSAEVPGAIAGAPARQRG